MPTKIDYQMAHNLRELREWANKGYDFVAVIDSDSWLVVKTIEIKVEEEVKVHTDNDTDTTSPSQQEDKPKEE